jgi:phosphatidylglycerophosphatase A
LKKEIEKRESEGLLDYLSLAVTTFGVGYLPLAPGTWGSMVGIGIYLGVVASIEALTAALPIHISQPVTFEQVAAWAPSFVAWTHVAILILFLLFCLLGIWAAGRSTQLFGDLDPSQAVVDEVIGQLIVFLFVPFTIGWPFVLAGFLLFRIFDIWKPYPIDYLQVLPGGIGVCADDILAGVYAGICLSVIYAISLSL